MKINFKDFLVNENKLIFGQKIGDILTAFQDLLEDSKGMGARNVGEVIDGIINQIRTVLHGDWTEQDKKYLFELQKLGVYLAKGVEEKSDYQELINNSITFLEEIAKKLKTPQNNLSSEEQA